MSALAARTITTCVAFPFEYWRTLQQSTVGGSAKAGFRLGMKINSGFFSLLQRDLLFSGLYWILVENIRREVKSWNQVNEEGYLDKRTLLLSNIVAGGTSGAICAIVTLPLDVVKTRRQLHPKEYKNKSTWNILKGIYYKEGPQSLLAGMRQRVTKVTMSCAGVLTLYEFFSDALKDMKY
jgi:solute carrier family 25 protein 39/40